MRPGAETSKKLLGEKRDVKVWLSWLEAWSIKRWMLSKRPSGIFPEYEDLKSLFKSIIDKEYPEELYIKQFSLYIDNIVGRIDLQMDAYGKEENIPAKLFEVLTEQKQGLLALKEKFGAVVSPRFDGRSRLISFPGIKWATAALLLPFVFDARGLRARRNS